MLTARDQIEDKVEGLDAGADDYLPKPFRLPRAPRPRPRPYPAQGGGENTAGAMLESGDVTLDPVRHVVRHAGEAVELTAKEFALLATLLQRPGQVFTRSVLLDTVWGGSPDVYTNVVDLYVSYLRKKTRPRRRTVAHSHRSRRGLHLERTRAEPALMFGAHPVAPHDGDTSESSR
jgi:DNA-binding response OmpR family regulator